MTPQPEDDPDLQPPDYVTSTWGFLKEFLGFAVVQIVLFVVGVVVFTALAYVLIPDGSIALSLVGGFFYTIAAWQLYEAVEFWRGERDPAPADWGPMDLVKHTDHDPDVGPGACLLAPTWILFANSVLVGFINDELFIFSIVAAAVCGVLWLSTVLFERPRVLMPATYRNAETR